MGDLPGHLVEGRQVDLDAELSAIAGRCRAVLVDPPMAMSTVMALMNDPLVTMDRGASCSA